MLKNFAITAMAMIAFYSTEGCTTLNTVDEQILSAKIHIVPLRTVQIACNDMTVNGCQYMSKGQCIVFAIADLCVINHELKHCLGWVHPANYSECNSLQ